MVGTLVLCLSNKRKHNSSLPEDKGVQAPPGIDHPECLTGALGAVQSGIARECLPSALG